MSFNVEVEEVRRQFPQFKVIQRLTPSAQKAAFHVQDQDGADLCLKLVSPDYDLSRLDREIQAMQLLNHPNVGKLKEYTNSTVNGVRRHYLVEEFIAGDDLDKAVVRIRGNIQQIKNVFSGIASGLQALNEADIVHRDLKPSNVRVKADGTPIIIDFGTARHLSLPALTGTTDGAQIGTPLYFAPEQFRGTKYDIDHRTDLFALGVLLHEALVGRHPFYRHGMNAKQLQDAVCTNQDFLEATDFRSLSPSCSSLVQQLLEKDRIYRPVDATRVIAYLSKW